VGFGWQSQDLHPSGASGNASLATAEKGRIMAERCVTGMIDLLAEVVRYPLERIIDRESSTKSNSRAVTMPPAN